MQQTYKSTKHTPKAQTKKTQIKTNKHHIVYSSSSTAHTHKNPQAQTQQPIDHKKNLNIYINEDIRHTLLREH